MTDKNNCPFCSLDREPVAENKLCFAIPDKYPVSPGHMLIISRHHVDDYFDLSTEEKLACWNLVDEMKEKLETEHNPDGWNICINNGAVAGQTVFHMHIHLIPRYAGDVENPRGGLRNVIPGIGDYLNK